MSLNFYHHKSSMTDRKGSTRHFSELYIFQRINVLARN